MNPQVSIIVPVYNAQSYLGECLDSILQQTYTNWVCYLVNDGSTDDSQTIIDEYTQKDKRFIPINKPNEKSADLARKFAIDRIHTDWIMHVDSDDVIVPDFIEKMLQRQDETGADIVAARLIGCAHGVEGEEYRSPNHSFNMEQVLIGKEACILNFGGWTWSANNGVLYKKTIVKNVKYGQYMNSDEYSQRQLAFYADKVAFCDVHYLYRANEGTSEKISVRIFDRTLVDIQLEEFLEEKYPDRKDKIKAMTWQRLFNLIYLVADYKVHKDEFSDDEKKHIVKILTTSYKAIKRKRTIKYIPSHAWLTLLPYPLFKRLAYRYVTYKRSHGGKFFYR